MGIWTKLGTVITPLAADGNSGLYGGTSNQDVLYDTSPQLISANPDGKVFKMWFMGKNDLFYAESNNGITWTRRGAALQLTTGQVRVWKDSGTYYIYATTGEPTQGPNGITTFTSSDGITLTSQGVGLAVGGIGQFDHLGVWYLKPWFKTGSTWSAIYSTNSGQGIATSTDLIHWTNAASALSVTAGGPYPLLINGMYYIYTAKPLAGANNQLAKVSSPDLTTWTTVLNILPETQTNEGSPLGVVNSVSEGQGVPTILTGPNGWTYLYYSGTAVGTGAAYTVMGAVTQMPLAQVVTSAEGMASAAMIISPSPMATDNMQRANETPLSDGGKWTLGSAPNVNANLVSNQAVATSTTNASRMCFTGATWGAGQWSQITATALDANGGPGPSVLTATGQTQGYEWLPNGTLGWTLRALLPGGTTAITLQSSASGSNAPGDVIQLAAAGSELQAFKNGTLLTTVYDSMFLTGIPGFISYNSVTPGNSAFAPWSGGSVMPAPIGGASSGGDLGPGYDFKFRM